MGRNLYLLTQYQWAKILKRLSWAEKAIEEATSSNIYFYGKVDRNVHSISGN